MRKIVSILLISSLLLGSAGLVCADVIPIDSHLVKRCVKVEGLENHPKTSLIAFVTGPVGLGSDYYQAYLVEPGQCLQQFYKFNKLALYWTRRERLNVLDLDNLKIEEVDNGANAVPYTGLRPVSLSLLKEDLYVSGQWVPNSNPLDGEVITYTLASLAARRLVFYKSGHISSYNDGSADDIQTFKQPKDPRIRRLRRRCRQQCNGQRLCLRKCIRSKIRKHSVTLIE